MAAVELDAHVPSGMLATVLPPRGAPTWTRGVAARPPRRTPGCAQSSSLIIRSLELAAVSPTVPF
ncbi:hypothetical protein AMK16_26070 [Streptomyces sp. CB00455]|nr:hypothetical protein AMK16_26070 [Streptomyces sp. CB00455]